MTDGTHKYATRRLRPADADRYRRLMLDAYEQHEDAFTSTRREREQLPSSFWEARVAEGSYPPELVIGAFSGTDLVGVVGLAFETRERLRHKATLFGMFVVSSMRGRGLGRRLVDEALASAGTRAGITVVQLTVSEANASARGLYESVGFTTFGIEPFAVGLGGRRFVTKVHMWRATDRL